MTISRKDVDHVARLARLDLTEEERDRLTTQLAKILDHAARVTSLATDGVEPTTHAIRLTNVMRDDVQQPPLTQEAALANAPDQQDGYFKVPRILEEEG